MIKMFSYHRQISYWSILFHFRLDIADWPTWKSIVAVWCLKGKWNKYHENFKFNFLGVVMVDWVSDVISWSSSHLGLLGPKVSLLKEGKVWAFNNWYSADRTQLFHLKLNLSDLVVSKLLWRVVWMTCSAALTRVSHVSYRLSTTWTRSKYTITWNRAGYQL